MKFYIVTDLNKEQEGVVQLGHCIPPSQNLKNPHSPSLFLFLSEKWIFAAITL
jgi:hypothetical protein